MMNRLHLSSLIGAAAFIWATLLIIDGTSVTISLLKPFSFVIGILTIVLILFENYLWKIKLLFPWYVSVPNISGTWKGFIISSWIDPTTGKTKDPIPAYLAIKQTFSTIKIRLMTIESVSDLLVGTVYLDQSGMYYAVGIYQNKPGLLIRKRSPIHCGALLIEINGINEYSLNGEYWTDRDTKGTLNFTSRIDHYHDHFNSADKCFTNLEGQVPEFE